MSSSSSVSAEAKMDPKDEIQHLKSVLQRLSSAKHIDHVMEQVRGVKQSTEQAVRKCMVVVCLTLTLVLAFLAMVVFFLWRVGAWQYFTGSVLPYPVVVRQPRFRPASRTHVQNKAYFSDSDAA